MKSKVSWLIKPCLFGEFESVRGFSADVAVWQESYCLRVIASELLNLISMEEKALNLQSTLPGFHSGAHSC